MDATTDCYVCLGTLGATGNYTPPCHPKHKLHEACFNEMVWSQLSKDPTKEIQCGFCREVIPVKVPKFLLWSKKLENTVYVIATIAVAALGIRLGIRMSSYLERNFPSILSILARRNQSADLFSLVLSIAMPEYSLKLNTSIIKMNIIYYFGIGGGGGGYILVTCCDKWIRKASLAAATAIYKIIY